jgi:pimeloyl-ACP methyl ester carboxylesterase
VLEAFNWLPAMISCLVLDGLPPRSTGGTEDVPYRHYQVLARSDGMDAFRREWAEHPFVTLRTRDRRAHALLAQMIARYPGNDLIDESGEFPAAAAWTPATIRIPTAVIAGEFDLESRKAFADELALQLPQAERVQIPDAGHLCSLDNPTAYNAAIRSFLARHAIQPTPH